MHACILKAVHESSIYVYTTIYVSRTHACELGVKGFESYRWMKVAAVLPGEKQTQMSIDYSLVCRRWQNHKGLIELALSCRT